MADREILADKWRCRLPPLRRAAPADEAQRGTGAGRGPPMGPPEIITNVITAVLDEAAESQHRQRIEAELAQHLNTLTVGALRVGSSGSVLT